MDNKNKSYRIRQRPFAVVATLCVLTGAGIPRFTFASRQKSQSFITYFQENINKEYKSAHYDYVEHKNPLVFHNNKTNCNCMSGLYGAYASDYYVAKAIGKAFFYRNLAKLDTILDFVRNCPAGAIIELPEANDDSIANLCSFRHTIITIKNSLGPMVLCERAGAGSDKKP